MTPKQQRFVDAYVVVWNATQAAIQAGYPSASAAQQGYRLLRNVQIRRTIADRTTKISADCDVSASRVTLELRRLGFYDIRRCFDAQGRLLLPHHIDGETAAAIQAIEVVTRSVDGGEVEYVHRIRFAEKKGPLELLGKRTGALTPETVAPSEEVQRIIFELRDLGAPSNKSGI
jgi:phage terminase small subunit